MIRVGDFVKVTKGPEFGREGAVVYTSIQYVDRESESHSTCDNLLLRDSDGNMFIVSESEVAPDRLNKLMEDLRNDARLVLEEFERRDPFGGSTVAVIISPDGVITFRSDTQEVKTYRPEVTE